jgi:carbamoyltransferase
MITWGISAASHDAALSVFIYGRLVFASHSERFSGIKNDPDLCQELIDHALQYGQPDQIYWYEKPFKKKLRQWLAGQGWCRDASVPRYLARFGIKAPVTCVDHHHSHAAGGYFTSAYDQAAVVVIDAIGEFETATIWQAQGDRLKKVWSLHYPQSVGLFYSAMTQRLGLTPNQDEYIMMGMAAYGNVDGIQSRMEQDFVSSYQQSRFKRNMHRGCLDWAHDLPTEHDFDIAASAQNLYEEYFRAILARAKDLVNSENLVLMGGCALNCSANRLTGEYFRNTWIMPNPGDAGSAVGCVLAKNPRWRIQPQDFTPFLGLDMGNHTSEQDIAEYLLDHKICGVARGPAEFGPRALGNRSLLADPRGPGIKDQVNEIKQRQQFRPFAPIILEEHVDEYFDLPPGWANSRYMQVVATCKRPDLFPAIVHVDGSSRVQTVPKDGSAIRLLLEAWFELTGCPLLLNTSLNIKDQPMVNDHAHARSFESKYGIRVFT